MKNRQAAVGLVFSLLFISAVKAQTNRSFVASYGSDSNDCSRANPCRSFSGAYLNTNAGGEIIALDSAGFGPSLTIGKSVSVIAPTGIYAGMTATSGTAITINAPGSTVVLRGLYLNSVGATTGVSVNSNGIAHIENLVVNGFALNGIEVLGTIGTTAEVFVKDAEVRDNGASGIFLGPSSGKAIVSIDRARLERNLHGLLADSGVDLSARDVVAAHNMINNFFFRNSGMLPALRATVEHSLAADGAGDFGGGGTGGGFVADNGARVTIRDSAAIRNGDGFFSRASVGGFSTEMALDHCFASENYATGMLSFSNSGAALITISNSASERNDYAGIATGIGGTVRAFGNTITRNAIGMDAQAGSGPNGLFISGGHNFVSGNTALETRGTITPIPPI